MVGCTNRGMKPEGGETARRLSDANALVKLLFEDWLPHEHNCVAGSPSVTSGAATNAVTAHSNSASPLMRAFLGCHAASPTAGQMCAELEALASHGRDLPAEGGKFPTDGDSHHRTSLSTLVEETLPTLIESALSAPGNVNHTRVLALLPLRDVMRRPRHMAILPGGIQAWAAPPRTAA